MHGARFSFGATAAIITNLAIIVGLRIGNVKLTIIGAMLVIAIADNISDSLGIHVYQESEGLNAKEVWFSTSTNFLTRVLVSFSFIFLVWVLPINMAVIVSIIWGLLLLSGMSYIIAKAKGINPALAVLEHLAIAVVVIIASNFLGQFIADKVKF